MKKNPNQGIKKIKQNKKVITSVYRFQNIATRFEHRKPERKAK